MKHRKLIIFLLVGIFVLTQLFGLFIINQNLNIGPDGEAEWDDLAYDTEVEGESDFYFILIFIVVLLGSLFYLFLFKKRKFNFIKGWYGFAIFFAVSFALYPLIKNDLIVLFISLVLAYLKVKRNNFVIHNITEILVYAGVASIMVPMMSLEAVFSLLILISLYDIYAVFHSKHMVDLAKSQVEMKLFSGLALPKNKTKMSSITMVDEKSDSNSNLKENEDSDKSKKKGSLAILGGGDVIFPLLFAGAVLKTYSMTHSFFIVVGSTIGLFFLFYFGKKGEFYPAMPYLSFSIILSWFLSILIL